MDIKFRLPVLYFNIALDLNTGQCVSLVLRIRGRHHGCRGQPPSTWMVFTAARVISAVSGAVILLCVFFSFSEILFVIYPVNAKHSVIRSVMKTTRITSDDSA